MKKIIAFVLAVCMLSSVCIVASAAYTPMSVQEMTEALEEKAEDGAKGAMALGWGFDDIKTTTKEYAKDAYAESSALAKGGKYIFTELSSAEVSALGIAGLEAIAELEKKDGSEKITLYKFTELADAQAYAAVLEEQKGEESDEYVRACGHTVAVGTRSLVYKVGVTVVDNAVVHGDFISTDCEQMESEYYQDLKEGAYSGMQFKTPDSAIIYKNGELVFSAAQKNYYETSGSYAGYQSVDAYMDIYASSFSYDELHEAHAGDSFVLSVRLRAPYAYRGESYSGSMNIFVPRCAFNVKVNGVQKKITIDQTVLQYNIATREVILVNGGATMNTGIFLSDYEYTTIAVHINPSTNSFDFYADGMLVAEGAQFLSDANLASVHANPGEDATGSGSDYTLTRVRLFYTNYKTLKGDLLCIDDFAWYFSDEYLEKAEIRDTVVAKSVSVGDKLYLNFYLNLNRATIYEYTSCVRITVGERTSDFMAMTGVPVEGGELDGLLRFTVGVDATEIDEPITLSMFSQKGRTLYLYGDTDSFFRGYGEYSTSVKECLTYIIDGEQFTAEARALARAALNYGAAAENYYTGLKFGSGLTSGLPNEGYEYADELDAISAQTLADAVESELYKEFTMTGSVPLLVIQKSTLSFDDGIYITVTYNYTGMKNLTVNGEKATGEYKIVVNGPDAINSVYTLLFHDGTNALRIKVSPLHLAANMMDVTGAPDYTVDFIKTLYLYNRAYEAYFNSLGEE